MNEPTPITPDQVMALLGIEGAEHAAILSGEFLGNTLYTWGAALITFLLAYVVLWGIKNVILSRIQKLAKKTKMKYDDIVVGVFEGIGGFFYFSVALFIAVTELSLPVVLSTIIKGLFYLAIVLEVIKIGEQVIYFALEKKFRKSGSDKAISAALMMIIKIVLWTVGLLLVLSNLGFNVNSLIASLGIGGLAISLALQNILGDIFSSFSIAVDKPFEEGDFIVCGDHMGTVKHIGLKTTRLEALQGEELVISNAELTTARVQNFKKMQKRRVQFDIGSTYETPFAKIQKIPEIVEKAIGKEEHAEFDRATLREFGDSELLFEVVYYVTTGDYKEYMEIQQRINYDIFQSYEKEGIGMAYPTRTVYMAK